MHSPHSSSNARVCRRAALSRRARPACLDRRNRSSARLCRSLPASLQTHGEGADGRRSLLRPATDFTKLEDGRGQARRRCHVARLDLDRQRLLPLLRQHGFQARARFQDRQRHLPQELDLGAVLDRCLRRAGPAVQRPRLPELPSEGWPRPSAVLIRCRRPFGLDAGQALGSRRDRRGEGEDRSPSRERASRSDLWRPAPGSRHSGHRGRGQAQDRIRRAPSGACRRRNRLSARAELHDYRSRLRTDEPRNHALAPGGPADDRARDCSKPFPRSRSWPTPLPTAQARTASPASRIASGRASTTR